MSHNHKSLPLLQAPFSNNLDKLYNGLTVVFLIPQFYIFPQNVLKRGGNHWGKKNLYKIWRVENNKYTLVVYCKTTHASMYCYILHLKMCPLLLIPCWLIGQRKCCPRLQKKKHIYSWTHSSINRLSWTLQLKLNSRLAYRRTHRSLSPSPAQRASPPFGTAPWPRWW